MKPKDGFIRDNSSGAVINVDNDALKAYKLKKKSDKEKDNEIKNLKTEVDELKDMVKLLLNKVNNT